MSYLWLCHKEWTIPSFPYMYINWSSVLSLQPLAINTLCSDGGFVIYLLVFTHPRETRPNVCLFASGLFHSAWRPQLHQFCCKWQDFIPFKAEHFIMCVCTVFFSIHLIMDTLVESTSWLWRCCCKCGDAGIFLLEFMTFQFIPTRDCWIIWQVYI